LYRTGDPDGAIFVRADHGQGRLMSGKGSPLDS
jgi:hypothetical protein